jgi:hypothetical protein
VITNGIGSQINIRKPLTSAKARFIGMASVAISLHSVFAAESTNIVLHTGGVATPITDSRILDAVNGPNAWVHFDFGFATAEEMLSGSFFDSITFTLQGSAPSTTTTIATLDRSGVLWAPITADGISLDPSSITWNEIDFSEPVGAEFSYRRAYSVIAPIPPELFGQSLTFFIDLFDNRNGVDSIAYASAPAVVPEPTTWLLALVGSLFVFGFKWRKQ